MQFHTSRHVSCKVEKTESVMRNVRISGKKEQEDIPVS